MKHTRFSGWIGWVDARFPLLKTWKQHFAEYDAPSNFNLWYFFGSLALLMLVNQVLSGIWLAMSYTPTAEGAFASIEYIMRDVSYGWLIRYLHTTGASFFFLVVYAHMMRGLLYGSFKRPRELLWLLGMLLFLCLMAEAFMGYLLPWGQMSFWGAQVITSLFGAIPYVGEALATWIRGDYNISGATLNRFFALHVVALPLAIVGLVFLHLVALHHVGSNNPDGVDIKQHRNAQGRPLDAVPFHPYYTFKDLWGVALFLIVFCSVLFFMPEGGGYFLEAPNFLPANPMQTPEHIAPVWYFTPFYSILRAVPDKFMGVVAMGASVALLFVLPWLDRSPVRSIRYRGTMYKVALALFVVSFMVLGMLGTLPPTPVRTWVSRGAALLYFLFFLLMPWYTRWDACTTPPVRLTHRPTPVWARWVMGVFWLALLGMVVSRAQASQSASLPHVSIDLTDQAALQRGAKYFANLCSGCHSMRFMRYNRMAQDIGITAHDGTLLEDAVQAGFLWNGQALSDTMQTAMQATDAATWFGVVPPDLTLSARARGADWLFAYLQGFYPDPSRPFGVNNHVYPGVGMPHVLEVYQGLGDQKGLLSESAYRTMVSDLVHFMVYAAEPAQLQRRHLGVWVLLFLVVFAVLAYQAKRELWKHVTNRSDT